MRISSGSAISRAFSSRPFQQRVEAVADQVGGGLVAGIENEDDVVQQLALGQPLAVGLALDQPGQHVALGIARMRAPVGDQRRR